MSSDWVDRESTFDMKHPHQVFLMQNLCMKMTFDTEKKMWEMSFPSMHPDDKEPWKKFVTLFRPVEGPRAQAVTVWAMGRQQNQM